LPPRAGPAGRQGRGESRSARGPNARGEAGRLAAREPAARRSAPRRERPERCGALRGLRGAPPMTTDCQSCGHESPATNRFCEECGAMLVRRCGSCGVDVPPTAKFCGACGASLVADPASVPSCVEGRRADGLEARKVVTVVFADLIGSTALHERLDAESVRSLMSRYYGALHAAVEAHGGTVVKLLGDGVMAAFGLPRVAEDDAMRAV